MTCSRCTGICSDSGDAGILSSRYTGQRKREWQKVRHDNSVGCPAFLTGRNNNMHNFGLTAVTVPQAEEYGEGNILQKQFSQIVEKEIERKMEPYWKLTENRNI